jgi:Flp pilus assembly pilin Flp
MPSPLLNRLQLHLPKLSFYFGTNLLEIFLNSKGVTAIEYALIASAVAIAILALSPAGTWLAQTFTNASQAFSTAP